MSMNLEDIISRETIQGLGEEQIRKQFVEYAPAVAIVVLVGFFSLQSNLFLTYGNLVNNVLKNSIILLFVSIGGTFPILQQSIDLSVAQILVLSAITTAALAGPYGILALPAVLLVGAIAGLVNGIAFTQLKVPSFLVTLGTLSIIQGISITVTGGQSILFSNDSVEAIASGSYLPFLPNLILWGVIGYVLSVYIALKTKFGRYCYAIGDNERVVKLSGVRVTRYKVYAFIFSGLFCSIGGFLLATRISSASPRLGETLLLTSITAIVIGGTPLSGGRGGPQWTILGVILIAVLQNGMSLMFIDSSIQRIILGVIIILAVAINIDRENINVVK